MDLSEVACMLCGRTLAEAESLLGDPVTGDRLCHPCAEGWSPDTFAPTAFVATATATIVAPGPDDDLPPPAPELRQLRRAIAPNEAWPAGCHDVRLLSLALYSDGLEVRARIDHPAECADCGFPSDRDYDCPDPHVTVVDDGGRVYFDYGAGGDASWTPDGAWTTDLHAVAAPGIATDARSLRVQLRFTDLAGADRSVPFEVLLDGALPSPAPGPQRVIPIGRKVSAPGESAVSVTWLFLDASEEGFALSMFVPLPPDDDGQRMRQSWLDASQLHVLDDRGNRYPMRTVAGQLSLTRAEVRLTCDTPLHPAAAALRVHIPDLVWTTPPMGMFGGAPDEPPVIDPGPFDAAFPLR